MIIILLVIGSFLLGFWSLDDFGIEFPFSISGTGDGTGVSVNKRLQFSAVELWSGTAENAKTIVVYSEAGAQLESLTTAATGIIQTAKTYESGTHLFVKFTDSNSKVFFDIVVPRMNAADAEANTYNDIALDTFEIGTYTSDTLTHGATTIADAGNYNATTSGDTVTMVYALANTGNDNTGLLESHDPLYNCAWQVWMEIKISGTGWETVVLSGVDRLETLGSAYYGYIHVSPTKLTKWKVGGNYVAGYEGSDSSSFSLDLTGYLVDSATMQITVKAYADPNYAVTHGGNLGPDSVEIAEQTVSLYT